MLQVTVHHWMWQVMNEWVELYIFSFVTVAGTPTELSATILDMDLADVELSWSGVVGSIKSVVVVL